MAGGKREVAQVAGDTRQVGRNCPAHLAASERHPKQGQHDIHGSECAAVRKATAYPHRIIAEDARCLLKAEKGPRDEEGWLGIG